MMLTAVVFLPLFGAFVAMLLPSDDRVHRHFGLVGVELLELGRDGGRCEVARLLGEPVEVVGERDLEQERVEPRKRVDLAPELGRRTRVAAVRE